MKTSFFFFLFNSECVYNFVKPLLEFLMGQESRSLRSLKRLGECQGISPTKLIQMKKNETAVR